MRNYLSAQGKTLIQESDSDIFDALLPDGIDDIDGPLYLEVKTGYSNKSGYFRNIERFAFHASEATPGAILLILGTAFTDESKQKNQKQIQNC